MFQRIYAIGLTAFRESVRDRVLFAVLGLGLASTLLGLGLGSLSASDAVRILVDQGLVTLSLLSNLIAIFLGANFLYKELELRTLYVLLARPVGRHELVLGKYLGILVTVMVFVSLTASFVLGLAALTATDESVRALERANAALGPALGLFRRPVLRVGLLALAPLLFGLSLLSKRVRALVSVGAVLPLSLGLLAAVSAVSAVVIPAETTLVLRAVVLVLSEVAVVGAASMLFSAFSTPFVTGMFSVGLFAIARSSWLMQHLPRRFPDALRALLTAVVRVVPNQHLFVPNRQVLLPENLSLGVNAYLVECVLYALSYAAVMLSASVLLFRRRDLV
ncbi:MAG: hypothetical protein JNK72_21230 [Myxococcales bacterium]|nr:hypothetical protein [Myxococcales bacterium]